MKRLALVAMCACSALWGLDTDQGFTVRDADTYDHHQTSENITIAAEPYITQEQAEAAFGKARPYDYGILPVLVVIQNDTGKAMALDLKAEFVTSTGEHLEAMPPDEVQRFQGIQERPGIPRPNPLPIPLPRRNRQGPLNQPEIDGRAWAVKLIPPGESASGFVYFQAADLRGSLLYLTGLRDAASGQPYFYFEIPLD